MYQSTLDPTGKLSFPFDPFRALHARADSELEWPEYPYKQAVIDRVRAKAQHPVRITVEAAAGALLMSYGEEVGALFEIEQLRSEQDDSADTGVIGWKLLVQRFKDEREAFRLAKRAFLQQEKAKITSILDEITQREQQERDQCAQDAWQRRQITKRYAGGSKYDGDGMTVNNVLVPHGHGTLWVPEIALAIGEMGNGRRIPRYKGKWMDGFMHGKGTYYWQNGDSWEGNFIRDEMQGKGVYTSIVHSDKRGQPSTVQQRRIRYYNASQHVCWGDDLVFGCRLQILAAHCCFADSLARTVTHQDAGFEKETKCVVVDYNAGTDRHLVRMDESEATKWLSLGSIAFRLIKARPITRFENIQLSYKSEK